MQPSKVLELAAAGAPRADGLARNMGVNLAFPECAARLALRAKAPTIDALIGRVGIKIPRQVGTSSREAGVDILALGPDEWLIIEHAKSDLYAKFADAARQHPLSIVDVTDRNIAMEISGPRAETAINAGCPLDLSIAAFPVGKATRTVFERSEIVLFRKSAETFRVEIWRSFAPYFIRILEKSVGLTDGARV